LHSNRLSGRIPLIGLSEFGRPSLFADISDRSNDSAAFCARMLAEAGVAVSPGVDFDRTRGGRFVRFSYCGPEADMRVAAERLQGWR
jgi:aspartate/methionine/tyrosine aminotransferase